MSPELPSIESLFEAGRVVRLIANPGRSGVLTGKYREYGGKKEWLVRFPDGVEPHQLVHLEIVEEDEDPFERFKQGKFGLSMDLMGNLTHIRLHGRLANLIYSMNITNTDFYPYQYKPVLNFLYGPGNGILIADEVGLGKTIEAGLIWTELRSRFDIRRVLILCPAMLRDKWKAELFRRFGIAAEIVDASGAFSRIKEYRAGERHEYAMIGSFQGLRPRRGWIQKKEDVIDPASKLAKLLSESQYDDPLFDLLIVDEAHYMRNPSSMTSNLGRLLRDVSDNIVLLSATPVHLKNQDLFQLLNLVDENTFNQPSIFDEILKANEPLLRARDEVIAGKANSKRFIELLNSAKSNIFFKENRQIHSFLENPPSDKDLIETDSRVGIANRLDAINLFGKLVNRTRKREIFEWRVVRNPVPEKIAMTDVERQFYENVTNLVRDYAQHKNSHEGFLMVTPQRQMSSSMPAAIAGWQKKHDFVFNEQLYEDLNVNEVHTVLGPLTWELVEKAYSLGNYDELRKNDSKYKRLKEILTVYLNENPNEKVVLFAYFRPTLKYLHERLKEDGIPAILLMGGGELNKYQVILDFEKQKEFPVLLTSEVSSEGVDMPFARFLVNYDLPWNPMKVEQRIGRLDRIGQKSPSITIWNLFYEDTIDDRIYNRLYLRLKIFEKALGGIEPVIGEEIRKLTLDLLFGTLTKEQQAERIDQTETAIANMVRQEETLEEEAGNLLAHGDYILNHVKTARELKRTITSEDIWNYVHDYFSKAYYDGSDFNQVDPNRLDFDVKLSDKACHDLSDFLLKSNLHGKTRLGQSSSGKTRCRFENQVDIPKPGRVEVINQFHPLVRFVCDRIKESNHTYYSPVSLSLTRQNVIGIQTGIYAFVAKLWSFQGIREIEKMNVIIKLLQSPSFLPEDDAEKLITVAARQGNDWKSVVNQVDVKMASEEIGACIDVSNCQFEKYRQQIENENNDRSDVQEQSLKEHLKHQVEKQKQLRDRYLFNGQESLARMTQGKIDKLNSRCQQEMVGIDQRRTLKSQTKEICIGLIKVM